MIDAHDIQAGIYTRTQTQNIRKAFCKVNSHEKRFKLIDFAA